MPESPLLFVSATRGVAPPHLPIRAPVRATDRAYRSPVRSAGAPDRHHVGVPAQSASSALIRLGFLGGDASASRAF